MAYSLPGPKPVRYWRDNDLDKLRAAVLTGSVNVFEYIPPQYHAAILAGTSSEDVSEYVQAAINDVTGIVDLPAGRLCLESALAMRSNVTLRGAGSDLTTIQQIGTVASWAAQSAYGVIWTPATDDYERVVICDFTLQGLYTSPIAWDSGGPFAKDGIHLQKCERSRVERVKTADTSSGIVFAEVVAGVTNHHNTISDCEVRNAKSWSSATFNSRPRGVLVQTTGVKTVRTKVFDAVTHFYGSGAYNDFDSCWAEGGTAETDNGFYVQIPSSKVTNCTAKDLTAGSGFAVAYENDVTVANNHAINCPNMGFRLHVPMSYSRVIGNEAEGCGYGFAIDTASHSWPDDKMIGMVIQGNTAKRNELCGFAFLWLEDSSIVGNVAIENNQGGMTLGDRGAIRLGANCHNNEVRGNICQDLQAVPTQLFGLYSATAADTGASAENVNRIGHTSAYGVDVFPKTRQTGTYDEIIPIGDAFVSGSVGFPEAFTTAPKVLVTIQNGNVVNNTEHPLAVVAFGITTAGFEFVLSASQAVAGTAGVPPTITFAWEAFVE